MNKIRVRLDFDSVLNDLNSYWRKKHFDQTGEDLEFSQWDLHEISVHGEKIYDHLSSEDFFLNCPPKKGSRKTIQLLEASPHVFDYKIISSCQLDDQAFEYVNLQKLTWSKEHLSDMAVMNFILVGEDKSEFKADVIVDDKPENLINQKPERECLKILFRETHNTDIGVEELRSMDKDKNCEYVIVNDHKDLQKILYEILDAQSIANYFEYK